MAHNPVRRAQLVAPFGAGAMVVVRDGSSLICAGLDHWFEPEDRDRDSRWLDLDEFRVEEWRLQQLLDVRSLRLPPDYRTPYPGMNTPNVKLGVPFLRFPQWHFCPRCRRLEKLGLAVQKLQRCSECKEKRGWGSFLVQVPFIAICQNGHLQDFPWREWVHESRNPSCEKPMRLEATGGATLAAQRVTCECGVKRSLEGITSADPDGTSYLSKELEPAADSYLCQGKRPWLGTENGEPCQQYLRGSLRGASNVYFANIRSAIYLPRGETVAVNRLVSLLEEPPLATLLNLVLQLGSPVEGIPQTLRGQHRQLLELYNDNDIVRAVETILNSRSGTQGQDTEGIDGNDKETAFRRAEYDALRVPRDEEQLMIRASNIADYGAPISNYFSRVMLINKLRETRALSGFRRIFAENEQDFAELRRLMWANQPSEEQSWLPAYIVYGEGIYLELEEARLREWEARPDVRQRVKRLIDRYEHIQTIRHLRERPISPRFVLLHTLSHLIMNRLTFECGYSSAALKERLYVSEKPEAPMAGLLIYTAAGDAEGTMGGVVRMGKPSNLEPVIERALAEATWCSADPICMELGDRGGQGPDSCNLAGCHNCSLVPETACEEFNRFLDRGLVVGSTTESVKGFFERS